jgi:hypothetical protein
MDLAVTGIVSMNGIVKAIKTDGEGGIYQVPVI